MRVEVTQIADQIVPHDRVRGDVDPVRVYRRPLQERGVQGGREERYFTCRKVREDMEIRGREIGMQIGV